MSPRPQMRQPPPVVRSAWIEDSVRARRKLPVAEYMVDGIFVQKGTLAASFAAAATPKKLPPQASASPSSRKKSGLSSGGSTSSNKVRASSGGAGKSQPSRLAATSPNGASGPNNNYYAADRLATPSSDRVVDIPGGGGGGSADRGMGEEGRRPGRGLEGTETALAVGKSSEVSEKRPAVSTAPLNVGGGGDGGGGDGAPTAPLALSAKEQPAAVETRSDDTAVATPAPHAHASGSGSEGKRTPAGDKDNASHRDTRRLEPKSGDGHDEPTQPVPKGSVTGGGDGGSGSAGGGSNGVGGGGPKGPAAAVDIPPPLELPDMGAAGEGGRSTKDDPAFMKTFFRNSRLHFIGVG